ncbi:hypothetical protein ACLOAV_005519 [Pseudogymnoascus australis]
MPSSTDRGDAPQDAIAIVGMSCRFSGIATSPEGLWQMLSKGYTGWTNSGRDRFSLDSFWHPQSDLSGSFNARGFHLLNQDPALFDSAFFRIPNVEAKAIDPQQRMMLEVAYEAFEDAGIGLEELAGSDTAGPSILANRVSYFFDLHGPSMAIDTACSGGLVALHQACQSIRAGETKQALVGGVNLILDPDQVTLMSSMSLLSPHGRCYAFDSRANGFGRGEGIAALILKPLDQALRDGDAIRAVIQGSGVVQDGHTAGITMPSSEAQINMINKVYEQAGLNPSDTPYVEAHGTGTAVGDKIEAGALRDTFCKDSTGRTTPLLVGSVKSNIGHTESVAGLAGVIKAVLMLEKGLIPPNPTFIKPSDSIPLDTWNMDHKLRRASVNSFGYGGTNAHVILEALIRRDPTSSTTKKPQLAVNAPEPQRPRLFVLTHALESGVREAAANLRRFVANLDDTSRSLDNLAFTLSRRSVLNYRLFVTASTQQELIEGLDREKSDQNRIHDHAPPKLCFAFTGQGAQWAGMGCGLLSTNPIFKQSMQRSEEMLLKLGADWQLIQELNKQDDTRINEAELSQPICTAIQIALVDMLADWNVFPVGVVGHSSGEIAAAYAVGMLSAEDALSVAYHRGVYVRKLKELHPNLRGAMLAAGISAADAQAYLVDDPCAGKAVVACENSPGSVTISGDEKAVSIVQGKLEANKIFNRSLVVDAAYHSHHMELVQEAYWASIKNIQCGRRQRDVHMISSVHGEEVQDADLDASYWCKNLTSPVRFSDSLAKLLRLTQDKDRGAVAVVEIGPHSALAGPIKQIIKGSNLQGIEYLPVLVRKQDASNTAITAAGRLFQLGYVGLDRDTINDPHGNAEKCILSDLPRYGWAHKTKHWSESRRSAKYRLRKFPRHDLLGTAAIDTLSHEPMWRNYLRLQEQPWLVGHSMGGSIVFPAAGYLAMALEALKQTTLHDSKPWKNLRVTFQDVIFGSALIIPEDAHVETVFVLRPCASKESWKEFRVFSITSNGDSAEHCRGIATIVPQGGQKRDLTDSGSISFIDEVSQQSHMRVERRKLYRDLRAVGVDYTGLFAASNGETRASQSGSVSSFPIPDAQATMPSQCQQPHCIHPSTLDLCFQSAFPIMKVAGLSGSPVVVASINSLEIHTEIPSKPGQELHVSAKLQQHGRSKVITDTVVSRYRNGKPSVLMKIDGLVLAGSGGPLQAGTSQRSEGETLTHRLEWSIDTDLAQLETITKHCQLECATLVSSGHNRICEEYAKILVQQTVASIERIDGKELKINGHFVKLLEWMRAVCNTNTPFTATVIQNLEAQVKAAGALGEMLVHIGPHLVDILQGDNEALGLLQEEDRLNSMYNHESYNRGHQQLAKYVQLLQFKNPNLRILEIGAGKGRTTLSILEALSVTSSDSSGRPKLGGYTFTDISTCVLDKAKDKLKARHRATPSQQGIQLDSFDLIIASNVLHATRDVGNTLHNVRSLLKAGGHLALLEFTVPTVHTGLIFGLLPGWWLSDDGRNGSPLLDVSIWDKHLHCCGFSGVEVELPDFNTSAGHELSLLISTAGLEERLLDIKPIVAMAGSFQGNLSILPSHNSSVDESLALDDLNGLGAETVAATIDSILPPKEEFDGPIVHIVHSGPEESIADHLTKLFRGAKIPAKKIDLATGQVKYGQPVVMLIESRGPFLARCSESEWERVRQICCLSTVVLWVTTGAAVESSNPMSSLITGLSRCLRSEDHSIKFITLDLEAKSDLEQTIEWEIAACGHICKIAERVLRGPDTKLEPLIEEWEYAIRGGEIMIPRLIADRNMDTYIRDNVSHYHPQHAKMTLQSGRALGLNIQIPGLLDTLYWEDSEKHSRPVKPEEVRVELEFISLNFKDVMIAMGQLDGHKALLLEGSGRVVEIGEGASGQFSVGDAVYVLDFDGIATTSNIHCSNVHQVPPGINLEVPAAVGIAYATAYYALVNRGQLQPRETVLIHSGAGAVGQAAITLAKEVCAAGEIFVTVGSDEKREFIKNKFGIPEENIFSSRGLDFYQGILQRTAGEGVDVVINSLSGESLQKSVQLLAPLGRFVEIGKKDLLSSESRLEMRHLERNIQFSTVDLTLLGRRQPAQLRQVFATVLDLLARDQVAIINPIKAKSISETEESFRLMQTGQHMGKLLLRVDPEAYIPVQPPKPTAVTLNADSSYLVIGGTGGLGKATLRLLADLGAKRLITISRSGIDNQAMKEVLEEMSLRGVEVTVHKGSVLDKTMLRTVSEQCKDHPIRGVVQGAMVLQDSRIEDMKYEQWRAAMDPKVSGTWNIHEVFGASLDFFVLFSSSGGIIGSFGQGNYCAGNTFQDAFARYLAGLGLPGRSINIGFVEGEGYTADNEAAADFVRRQGLTSYRLQEFLVTVEEAIKRPIGATPAESQLLCGISRAEPTSSSKEAALQRPDPKFSHIWRKKGAASQDQRTSVASSFQTDVQATLRSCTIAADASEIILQAIRAKLARLLAVAAEDILVDRSVASHGMDSLVAVELRNWIAAFLEAHVQTFELMSSMAFTNLALLIARRSHLIQPRVFAEET